MDNETWQLDGRIIYADLTPEQEDLLQPRLIGNRWDREKKQHVNIYRVKGEMGEDAYLVHVLSR